ncbi:hypothetical protein Pr1d_53140 [Bythopirellula goksoeyrii]|uniref:Uncharacterized protein n=1 Tax=Bythopirellula goksoeyrii TaxID=1400387 RepID=A0A5B9QLU0_9BACT|nr:hypothetical protein Pr1d_53140 [Bythopirellula goksoeyrii]
MVDVDLVNYPLGIGERNRCTQVLLLDCEFWGKGTCISRVSTTAMAFCDRGVWKYGRQYNKSNGKLYYPCGKWRSTKLNNLQIANNASVFHSGYTKQNFVYCAGHFVRRGLANSHFH